MLGLRSASPESLRHGRSLGAGEGCPCSGWGVSLGGAERALQWRLLDPPRSVTEHRRRSGTSRHGGWVGRAESAGVGFTEKQLLLIEQRDASQMLPFFMA